MKKELQEPQMTRMPKSLKVAIQESADKYNKGNFNREVRELIQIGLKNRKRGGKTIKTDKQHEPTNEAQNQPCNIYGVSMPKGTVCPRCKDTGMYYEPESSYPRTPCDECGQTAC